MERSHPIFIGGSARSGTHAVGRLVAAHPRYHLIPVEVRIHAVSGGLPDLLAGRSSMSDFLGRCRGQWWSRGKNDTSGLRKILSRRELEAALGEFEAAFELDPWGSSRALVTRLLDPIAEHHGKPSWIDVTGRNVESAPTLARLFPRAKIVHMVRDGRAVVAGHLKHPRLGDDPMNALRHWEQRIRAADAAIRRMPEASVLTMPLDDLAAHDREGSYEQLERFLGCEDDPAMRRYFDTQISAEAAHVGGWRERMAPPDARKVDRHYRKVVRELRRDGISWVPAPEGRWEARTLGRHLVRAGTRSGSRDRLAH
ncbi:MAG TPA: sulfotransferase [Thermoleophilaceae bacterium]|nr:sulfotransferase [Thermoleophilaceae bacterium]